MLVLSGETGQSARLRAKLLPLPAAAAPPCLRSARASIALGLRFACCNSPTQKLTIGIF